MQSTVPLWPDFRHAHPDASRDIIAYMICGLVADTAGLGVHATLDLAGRTKFGPDVQCAFIPSKRKMEPSTRCGCITRDHCLFRISRRAAKNIVDTAARWIEDGDDWRYDVEPSRADSFYEAVSASLARTRARVLRCTATLCTQPRVFRYAHTTRRWKMELYSRTTRATLSCSSLRLIVATDTSTRRSHSLTAVCCAMLGVCGPSFLRPGSQLPTFYFMIGAHTV